MSRVEIACRGGGEWRLFHVAATAEPIAVIPAAHAEACGLTTVAVDAAIAEAAVLWLHDRSLAYV